MLVTPGEPAGIGPDILLQWWATGARSADIHIAAVADPELLRTRARLLGLDVPLQILAKADTAPTDDSSLPVLPCPLDTPVTPGQPDAANAAYVLRCLTLACDACLDGQADGMITGPVQKSIINDAGIAFSGHTEFLADYCSSRRGYQSMIKPVMMLATPGLRVALVTTHMPLRDVPAAITRDTVHYCLQVLNEALVNDFGIPRPRLLVSGLNPHAGEQGHLGDEEQRVLLPVIEDCCKQGMQIEGPLPADTLFTPKYLDHADAVLAMYHDQGLPVLKYKGFGHAVNITLGLPILRTSVDHGTALDLAGTGHADSGSLAYAIECAVSLTCTRRLRRHA